jgi:hypothetical protein
MWRRIMITTGSISACTNIGSLIGMEIPHIDKLALLLNRIHLSFCTMHEFFNCLPMICN